MQTTTQNDQRRQLHLEEFARLQEESPSVIRAGILYTVIWVVCYMLAAISFVFFIICLIFGGWKYILNEISPIPDNNPDLLDILNYLLLFFTFSFFLLTYFIGNMSRKILRRNGYIIRLKNLVEKILSKEEAG